MGALLQYISASALSVTLGGNSGVAPFMTLLIVGIIERIDPSILNMEDWVQKIVSSWPSIVVLGALTIVELVAKFVPCVDVVYESSMAFVAPILSIFGSRLVRLVCSILLLRNNRGHCITPDNTT